MTKKKESSFSKSLKDNLYYILMGSFLLGVILGTSISNFDLINLNKGHLNTEVAKQNIQKYIAPNQKIEFGKIKKEGEIYLATLKIANTPETPILISENGKKFYMEVIDADKLEMEKIKMEEMNKPVKSKKPKVELFVMSYCPFGTQAEKGYLPAVKKLGDKIDAEIKFVNYVMHPGQGETEENLRQFCIQKTQKNKFNDYLKCFLEKGDSKGCIEKTGIDKNKLSKCEKEIDKKFNVTKNLNNKDSWLNGRFPKFSVQDDLNKKYDIAGSPTLVVNGKKVQAGRSPQAMLDAICESFTDEARPKECDEKLSNETPKSGFGYGKATQAGPVNGGCGG